ncbi:MAG: hypothetical protein EXS35_11155 [Pedosphaera sp.]|nr:hypothetical protein [Pedosphaera sp.]
MKQNPHETSSLAFRQLSLLLALFIATNLTRAATFTVVNTNATGDGSLQQAIFDANTNAGTDTITFAITNLSNTIRPAAALPIIVEPVTIDGRTQTGFVSAPIVEISGGSAGAAADGLKINTSNCVISALVINGFLGDGIEITNGANNTVEGCYLGLNLAGTVDTGNTLNGILLTNAANNTVGGPGATNRNYISGNNASGINVGGATAVSNSILGNVIGLNVTNGAVANSTDGIRVNAPFTSIGGSVSGARNVISGNTSDGIEVGALGTNCVVKGNYIGTDTGGTLDKGNTADGIFVNTAAGAIIGGTAAGEGNLISGNNSSGIELSGTQSTNSIVLGNIIGADASLALAVANSLNGILITSNSRSNVIGGVTAGAANTIWFNGADGVSIASGTNNPVRGNSIYANGTITAELGIDLGTSGVTANDSGDPDTGANQLQNFPVLTAVSNTATDVTIVGSLNSKPSTTYTVDFYSSLTNDTAGSGEGQTWIGATNLTTAADSNVSFTIGFTATLNGRYVTATATDPFGNTSEFSLAVASVSSAAGQTFTVINTNDSGAGSLRAAINSANAAATTGDRIEFNITGAGVQIISPASALPEITDPVTIDGYTQPGSATNSSANAFNGTLLIRLSGVSAGTGANGLTILAGNTTVRGLLITGFPGTAGDGIEISGPGNNVIEGNIIGLDSAAADQGSSGNGVLISVSSSNLIGGTAVSARNVISGNASDGIEINGPVARGNQIYGNLIGTDFTGTSNRNNTANGVFVSDGAANLIGGAATGQGNLISANQSDGVELNGTSATNNFVRGNRIGVDVTGVLDLGNGANGILITSSSRSNIIGGVNAGEGNVIAFNTDGIGIAAATSNTNNLIRGNSIHSNSDLGIDLGASGITANDAGDPDLGANQQQNFPVLTGATNSATEITFAGTLNSAPSTTFTLDFYSNVAGDEGQTWLGGTNLTTGADSNLTFLVSLPLVNMQGRYVTATATDPFGNSSEFSARLFAASTAPGQIFTVINTNDSGAGSLRQAITDANAAITAGDTIAFNIPGVGVQTIRHVTALPQLIDPATIDGYTQPASATNTSATAFTGTVLIRLDGSLAPSGTAGLDFTVGNNTLRGLCIVNFIGSGADAVRLAGAGNVVEGSLIGIDTTGVSAGSPSDGIQMTSVTGNRIGGDTSGARNVISGNGAGVNFAGSGNNANQILGNLIGTDLAGTLDRGNTASGIIIGFGVSNVIGGATASARNVISGNNQHGLNSANTGWLQIQNNYFGTTVTGTGALGNGIDGIILQTASSNAIVSGNVIGGNTGDGIELNGVLSKNNTVTGNFIGTDATGTVTNGNGGHGVNLANAVSGAIVGVEGGANTIAFNTADGVSVASGCTNNSIRANAIFLNGELCIDLGTSGITPNDAGDADTGANQQQNFPVLSAVTNSLTGTDVAGSLNS